MELFSNLIARVDFFSNLRLGKCLLGGLLGGQINKEKYCPSVFLRPKLMFVYQCLLPFLCPLENSDWTIDFRKKIHNQKI